MSKTCSLTGKKPSAGNNRSHSLRATKRRFEPNLQTKTVVDPRTGKKMRMKLSTSALRTMVKSPRSRKKLS